MSEKLIELVRKYPCLYNTKDISYKNVTIKIKCWEQIGKEINETGESARKKWKSLRDNYMRYKKEVAGTTGQATKKFKKWPWASQLQFLDSTLTDRERSSNVREPTPEPSSDIATPSPEIQLPETPQSETSPPQIRSPEIPLPGTPHANSINCSRTKKIIKTDSEMDKVTNFLQNRKKQEYDAIDHLFQSYVQTFKSFSKHKQIKAKVELAKLFASIEAEELQEDVQILSNSPHCSIISTEDSVAYEVPILHETNFGASTSSIEFHNDNALNMYLKK
ncbi:uncharacterized protein LOC114252078 [Bombyx mandarina]|uniref:Uncharacterized protein LOC114252077 n=1 Tax=Bombyx mandarina TaxID=7092 RepID=A0A6J2KLD1_BOMMA|nr:uncharacterized protein LOC114252077 [Bombyx mandarina]XP_028042364.1 uncharacterized protein LOC114252078 [Bombyx mandarina]